MDLARKVFSQYEKNLLGNREGYERDYNRVITEVEKTPAKYYGKAVKFLYQPMFFDEKDIKKFEEASYQLMKILKKVIDEYIKNKGFREFFNFSPILEQLILKDPGYNIPVPMARFDVFYYPTGEFKFCELNADGSSGMVETRELQNIFNDSLAIDELKKDYDITTFELFDSWVDALLHNYRQFSGGDKKPNVAIIDRFSSSIPNEFIEFQKVFEKRGYSTIITDIRELDYRDGRLFYKDFQIDCIYRRAVTWEIIERPGETRAFIDAYLDGRVCVVGPIRSQIIHNKNIFNILHDPLKTGFLTEDEREFITKYIPYTRFFDKDNKELVDFTIANKDDLVLKPLDKYASYGVNIGRDFTLQKWKDVINNQGQEEYLLQDFCKLPNMPMAIFKNHDIKFIGTNYVLGLYLYNERFQGVYTRTSQQNVVGVIGEFAAVPNFLVKEKL